MDKAQKEKAAAIIAKRFRDIMAASINIVDSEDVAYIAATVYFQAYGLTLRGDKIYNATGDEVGLFSGASYTENKLQVDYKPHTSIDFILVDLEIKDIKDK